MENNEYTTSSKPSSNILHMIECDPKQTLQEGKFYVRTGALPANQDIKTYDVGLFQLATVGSQAAAIIGELHVSYDIEFFKPIDLSLLNSASGYAHYQLNGLSASNPLGTSQTKIIDNIGYAINGSGTQLTFPYPQCSPGETFIINIIYYGTSTASVAVPSVTLTNCSQQQVFNNNTLTFASNAYPLPVTSAVLFVNSSIVIGPGASLNSPASLLYSTGGTLPGGTLTGDLFIMQIPGGAL